MIFDKYAYATNLLKSRKPSLEVAPTTLAQRTRQAKVRLAVTCIYKMLSHNEHSQPKECFHTAFTAKKDFYIAIMNFDTF